MRKKKNPPGYWTKERCRKEALKYKTRNDFYNGSKAAHKAAKREGWFDEITSHMSSPRKPNGYWSKANCLKEALKYTQRINFIEGSASAYQAAREKGWLDEICSHMTSPQAKEGTWQSIKSCRKEALKYQHRTDFANGSGGAYLAASRNGWLDEVCAHMTIKQGPYKWSYEICKNLALNFNSRSEFDKHEPQAYRACLRHGWENLFNHMDLLGNMNRKRIYVLSFKDGAIYFGYSVDPVDRTLSHLRNSSNKFVKTRIEDNQIVCVEIREDWLTAIEADNEEIKLIKNARNKIGDGLVLNISDGGQRGGSIRLWTKDKCIREAKLYKSRTDFARGAPSAYKSAIKFGWLDEICAHMKQDRKPHKHWTYENCLSEAKKYTTRTSFQKGSNGAYLSALLNQWLDEICTHMIEIKKQKGTWDSIEACREEAKKYSTRTSFQKGSRGAYKSAYKHGWLDEICTHMTSRQVKEGTWQIKENCINEGLKYEYISDFRKFSSGTYKSCKKHGWLEEVCSHMKRKTKPNGYWTKERCFKEAKKYKNASEFQEKAGSAYNSAQRNGWLKSISYKNT